MKRMTIAIMGLLMCVGCGGPKTKPGLDLSGSVYPVDLRVEVNHERMDLSWRTVGDGTKSGYNIYISEWPLGNDYPGPSIPDSIPTYNTTPFPGDTEPDDGIEHFEATGLQNGERYFVTVRVVYPDQSVSRPSNQVMAACGTRREIELSVRFRSDEDGFAFESDKYVRADAEANDLYFFSKDGVDYLGSPSRLDNFIRTTGFLILPYRGSFVEMLSKVGDYDLRNDTDQVEISVGDWVLLFFDGDTHAYVNVKEFVGVGKDRRVKLFVAYAALAEELSPI